jgi:hypothetical protein
LRNTLVVTELVLSVVLLIGASLMIQSFIRMRTARLGFEPSRVLTFEMSLECNRYCVGYGARPLLQRAAGTVAALTGVARVGGTVWLPIRSCCSGIQYQRGRQNVPG